MSKGPGHVMRTIIAAIESEPGRAFDVDDLCHRVYPDLARPELKHRQAVIRAMRKLVLDRTDLAIAADGWKAGAPGVGRIILYRLSDQQSVADYERRSVRSWYEAHRLKSSES
ncbi:hypothetical protein [Sphingomonas agri]|uniref:hypothetical protein n=1 Tax=Sphingomonas agri TaxID=1813878 RepID=UPI00311F5D98